MGIIAYVYLYRHNGHRIRMKVKKQYTKTTTPPVGHPSTGGELTCDRKITIHRKSKCLHSPPVEGWRIAPGWCYRIHYILLKCFLILLFLVFESCIPGTESVPVINQVLKGNRVIPDGISRIYVEEIICSDISDNIMDSFKSSLRKQINSNDKISAADSPEESDMKLRVLVDEFYSDPIKINSLGVVDEKKMRIVSYMYLKYTKTDVECLSNKKVESEVVYSEVNIPIMSEYKALTLLTDQLAERIIAVITTGWYLKK